MQQKVVYSQLWHAAMWHVRIWGWACMVECVWGGGRESRIPFSLYSSWQARESWELGPQWERWKMSVCVTQRRLVQHLPSPPLFPLSISPSCSLHFLVKSAPQDPSPSISVKPRQSWCSITGLHPFNHYSANVLLWLPALYFMKKNRLGFSFTGDQLNAVSPSDETCS